MLTIVCGYDPREPLGLALFQSSVARRTSRPVCFIPLVEDALRASGLYTRPHERKDGQLWCPISEAPMATAFANSRFLVPWLVRCQQWALFVDGADMLALDDIARLFDCADQRYAVQVVKRDHDPVETSKMDQQAQTRYRRKNWSSVMLWNLHHAGAMRLTLDMVNSWPGRDLHAFGWLRDHEIGELPARWNHLVGVDSGEDVGIAHYTLGSPELGIRSGRWSDIWLEELDALGARLK